MFYKAYVIEEDEEVFLESKSVENVESVCNITSTSTVSEFCCHFYYICFADIC